MSRNQAREAAKAAAGQPAVEPKQASNEGQETAGQAPASPPQYEPTEAELEALTKPQAEAAPEPAKQEPAELGEFLEIISVNEQGFWRCGRQFTKKPKLFPLNSFSQSELERLQVEVNRKMIIVKLVEAPL